MNPAFTDNPYFYLMPPPPNLTPWIRACPHDCPYSTTPVHCYKVQKYLPTRPCAQIVIRTRYAKTRTAKRRLTTARSTVSIRVGTCDDHARAVRSRRECLRSVFFTRYTHTQSRIDRINRTKRSKKIRTCYVCVCVCVRVPTLSIVLNSHFVVFSQVIWFGAARATAICFPGAKRSFTHGAPRRTSAPCCPPSTWPTTRCARGFPSRPTRTSPPSRYAPIRSVEHDGERTGGRDLEIVAVPVPVLEHVFENRFEFGFRFEPVPISGSQMFF